MHEIYQLFGDDLEARGVFFYIFKAFDKVDMIVLFINLGKMES